MITSFRYNHYLLFQLLSLYFSYVHSFVQPNIFHKTSSFTPLSLFKIRGCPISKYETLSTKELTTTLFRETHSLLPDKTIIEDVSNILRTKHTNSELRHNIDNVLWTVVYPKNNNSKTIWKIKKTNKRGFYSGVPERVKKSIRDTINPSQPHIHKLTITRIDIQHIENHSKNQFIEFFSFCEKYIWNCFQTRKLHLKFARLLLNFFHSFKVFTLSLLHEEPHQIKTNIHIFNFGVFANPVLTNFYHIPYKKPCSLNDFNCYTITDNNIMFLDDDMIVMENTWFRDKNEDIYTLPVMVCLKVK